MRTPVAYAIRPLLVTICEQPDALTGPQRAAAGVAARRLLTHAWAQEPFDRYLVLTALQTVCRTFESDAEASAALLRKCLEPEHLAQHGYSELPWLAREVERLAPHDPELVEEIYVAVFTFAETSEEPTEFGPGRILPLRSSRRQDYESARYQLAEAFPLFLKVAPANALRALSVALTAYAERDTPLTSPVEEFELAGRPARIRSDHSFIWDSSGLRAHEDPIRMLDAFETRLRDLAGQANASERAVFLELVRDAAELAIIWRRTLTAAAADPDGLGRDVASLGWAPPILAMPETSTALGDYLRAAFSQLPAAERSRIEEAILAIPEHVEQERREAAERTRDRLIGCLDANAIVTDQARALLDTLAESGGAPANEPAFRLEWGSRDVDDMDLLAEQGVPVDEEPNRRIQELAKPAADFAREHLNGVPTTAEVAAILPRLEELRHALARAELEGVHPNQAALAWGYLADACAAAARATDISCADETGSSLVETLLTAAERPEPIHNPERDEQFDEHQGWGSPAARIEAAEGLMTIAARPRCADERVLAAIDRLARDDDPAVRYQIAGRLVLLHDVAPEAMWSLLERFAADELSRGVLRGLVDVSLGRLAGPYAERVLPLVASIFERVKTGAGAEAVRRGCLPIFVGLYLYQDNEEAKAMLSRLAQEPAAYARDIAGIPHLLRDELRYGLFEPAGGDAAGVRARAWETVSELLVAVRGELNALEAKNASRPFTEWPEIEQELGRSLAQTIDAIGSEIYFASGAYDAKQREETLTARRTFLDEATPVIDELTSVGLPSLVHHLIETLEYLVPANPEGVFIKIGNVVQGGEPGGYQYESLAISLVVRLVERYLAEYRSILRSNAECQQALLDVLNIFVEGGWPEARRLTYQIDEIFR